MNPQTNYACLCPRPVLRKLFSLSAIAILATLALLRTTSLMANVPAAIISGTSPAVTLTDNGNTVTMANGIVSILCTKSGATINQINYTYNNGTGTKTLQLLNGGTDGGMLYWEYGGFGGNASTYSIVVNPSTGDSNHPAGSYAEIDLLSTSSTNGTVDIHFSMLRGSPGFYVTAIWNHRAVDGAFGMGETRSNIYAGNIFNWMTVDPGRNKLMEVSPSATSIAVPGAPKECYLWTNGIYQGRYDDKYKYSATFGSEQYTATPGPQLTWGWSSVGNSGKNVGLWDVNASTEYYNCGPMKRELMSHIGTTILNMFNGSHYAQGLDASFAAGEVWTKVYGPYFVYCNNVPSTEDELSASSDLYNDAVQQSYAEASGTANTEGAAVGATSWPYGWFVNNSYTPPSGRGTVTGQIVVSDTGNPNASGSNMFVGVVQQPATSSSVYDFQFWMKPYEFWVRADSNGNFTIPNVIPGTNYTLYAFGAGAESEFMSQSQTGGHPPILFNLPPTQFSVPVTGGSTTDLGTITWTPTRVGATVFEIGYPDRTARKFKHGEDYWVGDIGPSPQSPSPVWTKFLEYPFDFPNGMTYTVGANRWSTDWNFCQPVMTSTSGIYVSTAGTINFNLATAPAQGSVASFFLSLCSNFGDATIVSVNGMNLGGAQGVTSTPNGNSSNGYGSPYSQDDTTIREGINALTSDERITFPGSMLQAGNNTITVTFRQTGNSSGLGYFANHIMYDYMRLELTGYVPPAPALVNSYPGNNSVLLTWPVTPGATGYDISRTTTSGSNYSTIATSVVGPVCGSGCENASYLDTTASNDTTYYYVVQAVNTTGTSDTSPESPGVTPTEDQDTDPPDQPTNVVATASDGQVNLYWDPSDTADYFIVQRSTLYDNGGGGFNNLGTITLTDTATDSSYTDTTTTNGSTYIYTVTAVSASGSSSPSQPSANAVPLAAAPAIAPVMSASIPGTGQVKLTWTAVPGAVGYVLEGGTGSSGPFSIIASVTELTYSLTGLTGTNYYYVAATNSGGSSANSNIVSSAPPPPAPVITSSTLATVVQGNPFTYTIIATHNPTSFTATGLPDGISQQGSTAVISGTPTETGTFPVTLNAINLGGTGMATLSIVVTAEPLPVISSPLSVTGTNGFGFTYSIIASNNPTSFYSDPLPDGLTFDASTGLISGTPATTGTFTPTISAINLGGTDSVTLTLSLITEPIPVISSTLSATGRYGMPFTYQIAATYNPTSFDAGPLPTGLMVDDSTGIISGTPTDIGLFTPTLSAINLGGTGTDTLDLTILPPPPVVINSVLTASGTNGQPFSYQIQGNNNPTTFSAAGLPAGLTVDPSSGMITGTLGAGGIFPITLGATNAGGTGTATLMLTVTSSLNGMKGSYEGLAAIAGTSQGLFTMTLSSTTTGAFTAKLIVPGAQFPIKGTLTPTYGRYDSLQAAGRATLSIHLSVDNAVPGFGGTITITSVGGTQVYGVQSTLLGTYNRTALPPAGLAGYYTVVIPAVSSTDPSLPAGTGYGTMSVTKYGAVSISGKLGDGTAFIAKAPLHADGKTWTLFTASKVGSIAGTLTAESLASSDCDAVIDWIRYGQARGIYYPGGFTVAADMFAALYVAPALTTTSGSLTLSGGNLPPAGITNTLTISSKYAVTITGANAKGTSVRIVARPGAFSGAFPFPATKRPKAFSGVIYNKPTPGGYGLFLGTNQSGTVEITP
jgi:hypothetical protein